jgi:hypothetical protein
MKQRQIIFLCLGLILWGFVALLLFPTAGSDSYRYYLIGDRTVVMWLLIGVVVAGITFAAIRIFRRKR